MIVAFLVVFGLILLWWQIALWRSSGGRRKNKAAAVPSRRPFWFGAPVAGGVLVAVAVLLLMLTKGLSGMYGLFAVLGVLLPWILRGLAAYDVWRLIGSIGGSGAHVTGRGQSSCVETLHLRMTLDRDSGDLDGEVISGIFAGRKFADLERGDLLALLVEYRAADPPSANWLEAWLDRAHGDAWRSDKRAPPGSGDSRATAMDRSEAAAILGVAEDASVADVNKAYRRLMQRLHSDRGGSDYLAVLLNHAKDVLLGQAG